MSDFEASIKYTTANDYVTISDYFTRSKVEISPPIDPYLILGATPNDDIKKLKSLFRSKISTKDRQQRALLSLAYPILCSIVLKVDLPKYFQQISPNEFLFNSSSPIILILVGDCQKLFELISENRDIAKMKTSAHESLLYLACRSGYVDVVYMLCNFGVDINSDQNGSTVLHAATFFRHKDLVKFLIESGVSINIKNRFGNIPIKEAILPLKCLFDETKFDLLTKVLYELQKEPLFLKLEHIFFEKEIVAYRIQRKVEQRDVIITHWIRGWHGTEIKSLISIFRYGLLTPGESAGDFTIKVRPSHIQENVIVDNVPNFAHRIFISTSIYCASHECYAEKICTERRGEWRTVIEVGVRTGFYTTHENTADFIKPVKGDVDMVEVGIESLREKFIYDSKNNVTSVKVDDGINVVVLAVTLIKDDFLKKTENYANSEMKSEKELPDGNKKWTARTAKVILNGIDESRNPNNSVPPCKRSSSVKRCPTGKSTNSPSPPHPRKNEPHSCSPRASLFGSPGVGLVSVSRPVIPLSLTPSAASSPRSPLLS